MSCQPRAGTKVGRSDPVVRIVHAQRIKSHRRIQAYSPQRSSHRRWLWYPDVGSVASWGCPAATAPLKWQRELGPERGTVRTLSVGVGNARGSSERPEGDLPLVYQFKSLLKHIACSHGGKGQTLKALRETHL